MDNYMDGNVLTLGRALSSLRNLARNQYRTQEQWFADLLRSYHDDKADQREEADYLTAQPTVSKISKDKIPLPNDIYIWYTTQDDLLRQDMRAYLDKVIVTAKQRQLYRQTLDKLVDDSTNLAPDDKTYILGYSAVAEADQIAELLYRMMHILIHEPLVKAA